MIFTMIMATATMFQWWRLKTFYNKILKETASKASIVFYTIEKSGTHEAKYCF